MTELKKLTDEKFMQMRYSGKYMIHTDGYGAEELRQEARALAIAELQERREQSQRKKSKVMQWL